MVVVMETLGKVLVVRVVVIVLAVVSERRGSSLDLLSVCVESFDITCGHGSAQSRQGDGTLLTLGYCIGSCVLLLSFPEKVLP